ncbi:MAG: Mov34/MPN/PAD-1 family protein [Candidatus Lokiarchaeota archaeon]|nr:Mov34/MPN/PAD-1 family protein [Candidatus Lokiarchaeota archaeon]
MTKESTKQELNKQTERLEDKPSDEEEIGLEPNSSNFDELPNIDKLIEKRDPEIYKTPIKLTFNAYKRIISYALRYASEAISEKNWREAYGILIGSVENNEKVIIKDAIPMVVGERAGVKYENKQYVDMAQIDESVYERSIRDKKNDFIIGWWHTHPGFEFRFSDIDTQTQLGYQLPNPYAIALIFNHCKLNSNNFYLGLAALRLLNPERGLFSSYDYINLEVEINQEKMINKVQKVIKDNFKNLPKILKEIEYVDDILRKRALAQLQRNYGLILVPKRDIIITDKEEDAEEDDRYLYEWDPEFFKKSFRIPKFREKIEEEIKRDEKILQELLELNELKKYEQKKDKFKKKIQVMLSKPNDWFNQLSSEFTKRIEIIYPYYDYLDTSERKILEHFESRSIEYNKILDSLNTRAQFNLSLE